LPELTRESIVSLEGRAEPGTSVTVVGGIEPASAPAATGTGLFGVVVRLAPGANTLTLRSLDGGGNASPPVQRTITFDPEAPLPSAGLPSYLSLGTGDAQRGLTSGELPRPLIAVVKDRDGAPVAGVPVTFRVLQGGGRFVEEIGGSPGTDTLVVASDSDGYVRARFLCGTAPGPQLVRADFDGNLLAPVVFGAGCPSQTGGRRSQEWCAAPNPRPPNVCSSSGQQTTPARTAFP
jgi:hypothetical protein